MALPELELPSTDAFAPCILNFHVHTRRVPHAFRPPTASFQHQAAGALLLVIVLMSVYVSLGIVTQQLTSCTSSRIFIFENLRSEMK